VIPSSRTRVLAVIGDPVAHSLSPRFQNAAFRAMGLDAVYVALRVGADELVAVMRTLAANGGGGSITIPHKARAAAAATERTPRVELLGVANTFGAAPGGVMVENTDVDGLLTALDALGAASDAWYVAGTGGSARAVAGAALERGARLAVRSRDPVRAAAFSAWAASIGVDPAEPGECSLAVNATPLGLHDADPLPFDPAQFPGLRAALDLTYRAAGTTAWAEACRGAGLAAADGREMLLAQGAASWRLWFPGVEPPMEVMRAALDGRLD
jgi:shikimate dehydrogenase